MACEPQILDRKAPVASSVAHMTISLGFSDYLSIAALIASATSALYTKKQSEYARASVKNDYRAQLSQQHASYRKALSDVRERHKAELSELERHATSALTQIEQSAGRYDKGSRDARPLRHVLHECSEMVFYAFRGELAGQSGLNISMRLGHVSTIEDELVPKADYFSGRDMQDSFKRRYLKSRKPLEVELRHDRYFCGLISELKTRIDTASGRAFLLEIQDDLTPFREACDANYQGFRESVEKLGELLKEGQSEHFQLSESPQLYSAIESQKTILDILSYLSVPRIESTDIAHYGNYVSVAVHACAVLQTVARIHSWGWQQGSRPQQ